MKHIIATLAATVGLTAGAIGLAPTPADAHFVPSSEAHAICLYIEPNGYVTSNWRHIHYGSTDLTQCEYTNISNGSVLCGQHVWYRGTYYYWPTQGEPTPCW